MLGIYYFWIIITLIIIIQANGRNIDLAIRYSHDQYAQTQSKFLDLLTQIQKQNQASNSQNNASCKSYFSTSGLNFENGHDPLAKWYIDHCKVYEPIKHSYFSCSTINWKLNTSKKYLSEEWICSDNGNILMYNPQNCSWSSPSSNSSSVNQTNPKNPSSSSNNSKQNSTESDSEMENFHIFNLTEQSNNENPENNNEHSSSSSSESEYKYFSTIWKEPQNKTNNQTSNITVSNNTIEPNGFASPNDVEVYFPEEYYIEVIGDTLTLVPINHTQSQEKSHLMPIIVNNSVENSSIETYPEEYSFEENLEQVENNNQSSTNLNTLPLVGEGANHTNRENNLTLSTAKNGTQNESMIQQAINNNNASNSSNISLQNNPIQIENINNTPINQTSMPIAQPNEEYSNNLTQSNTTKKNETSNALGNNLINKVNVDNNSMQIENSSNTSTSQSNLSDIRPIEEYSYGTKNVSVNNTENRNKTKNEQANSSIATQKNIGINPIQIENSNSTSTSKNNQSKAQSNEEHSIAVNNITQINKQNGTKTPAVVVNSSAKTKNSTNSSISQVTRSKVQPIEEYTNADNNTKQSNREFMNRTTPNEVSTSNITKTKIEKNPIVFNNSNEIEEEEEVEEIVEVEYIQGVNNITANHPEKKIKIVKEISNEQANNIENQTKNENNSPYHEAINNEQLNRTKISESQRNKENLQEEEVIVEEIEEVEEENHLMINNKEDQNRTINKVQYNPTQKKTSINEAQPHEEYINEVNNATQRNPNEVISHQVINPRVENYRSQVENTNNTPIRRRNNISEVQSIEEYSNGNNNNENRTQNELRNGQIANIITKSTNQNNPWQIQNSNNIPIIRNNSSEIQSNEDLSRRGNYVTQSNIENPNESIYQQPINNNLSPRYQNQYSVNNIPISQNIPSRKQRSINNRVNYIYESNEENEAPNELINQQLMNANLNTEYNPYQIQYPNNNNIPINPKEVKSQRKRRRRRVNYANQNPNELDSEQLLNAYLNSILSNNNNPYQVQYSNNNNIPITQYNSNEGVTQNEIENAYELPNEIDYEELLNVYLSSSFQNNNNPNQIQYPNNIPISQNNPLKVVQPNENPFQNGNYQMQNDMETQNEIVNELISELLPDFNSEFENNIPYETPSELSYGEIFNANLNPGIKNNNPYQIQYPNNIPIINNNQLEQDQPNKENFKKVNYVAQSNIKNPNISIYQQPMNTNFNSENRNNIPISKNSNSKAQSNQEYMRKIYNITRANSKNVNKTKGQFVTPEYRMNTTLNTKFKNNSSHIKNSNPIPINATIPLEVQPNQGYFKEANYSIRNTSSHEQRGNTITNTKIEKIPSQLSNSNIISKNKSNPLEVQSSKEYSKGTISSTSSNIINRNKSQNEEPYQVPISIPFIPNIKNNSSQIENTNDIHVIRYNLSETQPNQGYFNGINNVSSVNNIYGNSSQNRITYDIPIDIPSIPNILNKSLQIENPIYIPINNSNLPEIQPNEDEYVKKITNITLDSPGNQNQNMSKPANEQKNNHDNSIKAKTKKIHVGVNKSNNTTNKSSNKSSNKTSNKLSNKTSNKSSSKSSNKLPKKTLDKPTKMSQSHQTTSQSMKKTNKKHIKNNNTKKATASLTNDMVQVNHNQSHANNSNKTSRTFSELNSMDQIISNVVSNAIDNIPPEYYSNRQSKVQTSYRVPIESQDWVINPEKSKGHSPGSKNKMNNLPNNSKSSQSVVTILEQDSNQSDGKSNEAYSSKDSVEYGKNTSKQSNIIAKDNLHFNSRNLEKTVPNIISKSINQKNFHNSYTQQILKPDENTNIIELNQQQNNKLNSQSQVILPNNQIIHTNPPKQITKSQFITNKISNEVGYYPQNIVHSSSPSLTSTFSTSSGCSSNPKPYVESKLDQFQKKNQYTSNNAYRVSQQVLDPNPTYQLQHSYDNSDNNQPVDIVNNANRDEIFIVKDSNPSSQNQCIPWWISNNLDSKHPRNDDDIWFIVHCTIEIIDKNMIYYLPIMNIDLTSDEGKKSGMNSCLCMDDDGSGYYFDIEECKWIYVEN